MAQRSGRGNWQKQQAARARAERQHAAWTASERRRELREAEQQLKLEERERREAHIQRQHEIAADRTAVAGNRIQELTGIVSVALAGPVGPLDLDTLKAQPLVRPLDLGTDSEPLTAPRWEDFVPSAPGAISRAFGGQARYEHRKTAAEYQFSRAVDEYKEAELARQQRVSDARRRHLAEVDAAMAGVAQQHRMVDELKQKVISGDRHAVSDYYQRVLDAVRLPTGLPQRRRAAYVPESTLLAIEWELPGVAVIPTEKEHQYIKARDVVEVRKSRPAAEIRATYQNVVAQLALRALYVAFNSDPGELVHTVVFNGLVDAIDPATGQPIRPCLITLRGTRDHFAQVNLHNVDPVLCVRKHFAADVSAHPEELAPVEPFLNFDMADPRIVDPVDIISELDRRPNLMDLTPKEFEHFVQNLFDHMGFDTKLFQASGDGGIDCIAYDPTPIRGGKYVIQVKQYTKTVPPTAVRDLFGVVHDQGATKGILITTSGFGPTSHEFANGKPLQLYDGTRLLWLCQQHGLEVRIVMPPKPRKRFV